MDGPNDHRKRLARLLDEVAVHEGLHPTRVEGVQVVRRSQPLPRTPMVYAPNLVIVGQGQKRAYLGNEVYVYDPFNYLIAPVPLPAECEADASPEEPVLLIAIHVDPAMLGELILELDEPLAPPVGPTTPRGILTAPMNEALSGAVLRLLECLKCPLDSRLLGRQTVREIFYRVLRSEQGGSFRALARQDEHFSRIARVLKHLHAAYAEPLRMEDLAKRAGMSVSAFHSLQAGDGQLAGPVPQAHPARPGQAAHGPRRLQRGHCGAGGRLREPVPIQPGVQTALRGDAGRGGRAHTGSPRDETGANRRQPGAVRPFRSAGRGLRPTPDPFGGPYRARSFIGKYRIRRAGQDLPTTFGCSGPHRPACLRFAPVSRFGASGLASAAMAGARKAPWRQRTVPHARFPDDWLRSKPKA
jgi:hypothetical protein